MTNIINATPSIIRRLTACLSESERELTDLQNKYESSISFIKLISENVCTCSMIGEDDCKSTCLSAQADLLLYQLGEL